MSEPPALPAPVADPGPAGAPSAVTEAGSQVAPSAPGICLRPGREGDLPLVYHSWLHTLREASPWDVLSRTVYFRGQHAVIENILARAGLVVAALEDDPDQILGYAVAEPGVLHWVYVKSLFRRYGVARALLAELDLPSPVVYTHKTKWCARLFKNGVYDPFKAWL